MFKAACGLGQLLAPARCKPLSANGRCMLAPTSAAPDPAFKWPVQIQHKHLSTARNISVQILYSFAYRSAAIKKANDISRPTSSIKSLSLTAPISPARDSISKAISSYRCKCPPADSTRHCPGSPCVIHREPPKSYGPSPKAARAPPTFSSICEHHLTSRLHKAYSIVGNL